jgi:hypothetical protein
MVPVAGGVIREEPDPCLAARFGKLLRHVPPEGAVHDVVVGLLCIPEAEAIVVFGQQHDVSGSCLLHDSDPLAGVELVGIPLLVEAVVLVDGGRIAARPADFPPGQCHWPPADEHPEAQILPGFDGFRLGVQPVARGLIG